MIGVLRAKPSSRELVESSLPSGTRSLVPHLAAGSLLSILAVALFASSFEAWGHPIIDLGRDLYLPSQILDGRVLYRDLLYNYGPAAPYLLAALTALLGDALRVFEGVGLAIGAATLCALYGIGNRLGGVWTAFTSALMFLVLSFFANSTWGCNFVLPYSFAATLAIAGALWSFHWLHRYLFAGRQPRMLALSVAFLFLTLLSKQEVGIAIAGVHALAWWTHRVPRKAILATLGSGAFVGLLFVAVFWARTPAEHALFSENLTRFVGGDDTAGFFAGLAGVDRLGDNLLRSLAAAGKLSLVIALAGLGGPAARYFRGSRHAAAVTTALGLAAAALGIWRWADVRIFQGVPVLAAGALCYLMIKDRKDPLVLLSAFVLLTGSRVLLQYHPMWYGFYLAVPGYLFIAYVLIERLPKWSAARWLDRRATTGALIALALLVGWRFESAMLQSFRAKTGTLVTAKGSLRDDPGGRAETVSAFLEYVETEIASRGGAPPTLVVLPEGVSLNYFTGFPNPTAYYLFTPIEISSPAVEARMIQELQSTRPEYLVMTSRQVTEYGRRGIGLDYAMELGAWIRRTYDLERLFEVAETGRWRLLLLKRRQP